MGKCRLDSSGLRQENVAVSFGHSDESLSTKACGEYLD
jgi:hypothetical protein